MINQCFQAMRASFDWLFPRQCFGCQKSDQPERFPNLCVFCWHLMFRPQRTIFPNQSNLEVFSCGIYEQLLKRCVILAKFKHHAICFDFLHELLNSTFEKIPVRFDLIASVPSDYWRSYRRGVDLPAMLAKELSNQKKIEFKIDTLTKKRRPNRQKNLNQKDRKQNVKNAFQASPEIRGKSVLIIDDILTTGSTILSCHRALERQKPKQIVFLTAAKTRFY